MFEISIQVRPVFIMNGDGEICQAISGNLIYNNNSFDFIEKDGLYAYSEFFTEGDWPEEYYENTELKNMYNGIKLKMTSGGWNESISDMFQSISHNSQIDILFRLLSEQDEIHFKSGVSLLKNDQGGELVNMGRNSYRYLIIDNEADYDPENQDGDNDWE